MTDYFYDRLSQLDHSFLVFEDTNAHLQVASTQIFDAAPLRSRSGGVDIDRVRDYVHSRLHLMPRYRQRLAWTPLEKHPIWVDDPRFNLLYHVRHTRLPAPGDERQLKRLAGRLMSHQLDRGKPLWELWIIEGLQGDRFAAVSMAHHCMIDGISGVDLIATLLTPEPTQKIDPPHTWIPRPMPSARQLLWDSALQRVRAPLALAGGLARLARDEGHARHDFTEQLRAVGQVVSTGMRNASNTPLNQAIGPYRRFDWLAMPLDDVRAVKNRLGGTVNDVVLAVVAGAVRRFLHEQRHLDVRDLDFRVMAPVSMRSDTERGTLGNRVSAWFVPMPLGERDPARRLAQISDTTARLKASNVALGTEILTEATEWTGTTVLSLGARLAAWGRPFNLVVTNVPGPPLPLYLLGARMLQAYPMVPLFGNLGKGIALFSYAGTLYWGVMADWDLIPDLHQFVLDIERSFQDLRKAADGQPVTVREVAASTPAQKRPARARAEHTARHARRRARTRR